jgi:hypothetical protein
MITTLIIVAIIALVLRLFRKKASKFTEKMMNTPEAKARWNYQKKKLREKFAVLTDKDLHYTEGKRHEMLRRVQLKLGKTREEFRLIMTAL